MRLPQPDRPLTLDLALAARQSANFLEHNTDEKLRYLPYFKTHYGQEPVVSQHTHWDFCENPGRYLYAIGAVRQMLGPEVLREAAARQLAILEPQFDEPDGLNYRPRTSPFRNYRGGHPIEGPGTAPQMEHTAEMWDNRSIFMGQFLSWLVTGDAHAGERARGMIAGLKRLVIRQDGIVRLAQVGYAPGYVPDPSHAGRPGEHMGGWVSGLVNWHRKTGDAEALEIALGFSRYHLREAFRPQAALEGRFNTHSALFLLAGMVRAARATGDDALLGAVREKLDWYLADCASSFGWVSESLNRGRLEPGENESCETCALADAIDCAIQLARSGFPEYWEVAERFTRNYLEEAQLRDVSWLPTQRPTPAPIDINDHVTFLTEGVPEKIRGCYVGWGGPNDFVNPTARLSGQHAIMHCCGPHGAFANWLAWHNILAREPGRLAVNLLISRSAPEAEVVSWLPFQGRVELHLKVAAEARLRVPGWAKRDQVRAQVDGRDVPVRWDGLFVRFADLKPGQTAAVLFPVVKQTRTEKIAGNVYTTTWRGDTVVKIDPPGRFHPFFERQALDRDEAPEGRAEEGYFPQEEIDW